MDVTENKRRKSKIELDRIRQLGEKQKIKEKSREREKPNVELESKKETKSKNERTFLRRQKLSLKWFQFYYPQLFP
jgi:hypothetical protein